MLLPAYAKLNLTLDILSRRADGYHELAMVMQSISLHDDVRVELTDGEGIVCRCDFLPGDESNLAVRAAKAFFEQSGCKARGVRIDVTKRIPMQAGMAGGSSDAAAVLRALRALLCPELPLSALEEIGASVGSDVPFCIRGGTALAQGRGERLTTLPAAPRFHTVVCKPAFSIATPMLFARSDAVKISAHPDTAGMLSALADGDAAGVAGRVCNVFEEVLPETCGAVFAIRDRLLSLGAEAAAMTGSGPTVFGLFRTREAALSAASVLRERWEETAVAEFV